MPDTDNEIEVLAARGRKAAERAAKSMKNKLSNNSGRRDLLQSKLLNRSLGLAPRLKTATEVIGYLLLIVAPVAVWMAPRLWFVWAGAGAAVILGIWIILWSRILYPLKQKHWLDKLPFEFDLTSYFQSLCVTDYHRRLEVEVVFQSDLDSALAETLCAAIQGALSETKARMLQPNTMGIKGPKLTTWFLPGRKASTASTVPVYDNAPLHILFRRCVRRGLTPIGRRVPIRRVTARGVSS